MEEVGAMSIEERRNYLARMRLRYVPADRKGRGQLLEEMGAMTGLHRKSLVRLMRPGALVRRRRTRQRGRVYGAAVDQALEVIWESLDYVCAERLTAHLVTTARLLAHHGELVLTPELEDQLGRISVSSVQRRLGRLAQDTPRLPRRGPERANRVARAIPVRRIAWDQAQPGHFETDLVHHGGASASGQYLHTLQMVDVATGWSERVALWGRSQSETAAGFGRIQERLPFAVREVHVDNGPEFLNDHVVRYWQEQAPGLQLSRSKPYHKNDNRFVEQKNYTLVRAYLGYVRLDLPGDAVAVNALYDQMWLYYNFFQPVLRLREKQVAGERVRRQWDEARTPWERVLAAGAVSSPERYAELEALRAGTNPRALRRRMHAELDALLRRAGLRTKGKEESVA